MIGSLGVPELIFILVLVLLVFGPKRLPEIGRTLGKGLAEFRKASTDLKRTINAELALEEEPKPPAATWLDSVRQPGGTEARDEVAALMASAPEEPTPENPETPEIIGPGAAPTTGLTEAPQASEVVAADALSSRPIEPS
jgi:TatA/E family protein of Tat protein translocase